MEIYISSINQYVIRGQQKKMFLTPVWYLKKKKPGYIHFEHRNKIKALILEYKYQPNTFFMTAEFKHIPQDSHFYTLSPLTQSYWIQKKALSLNNKKSGNTKILPNLLFFFTRNSDKKHFFFNWSLQFCKNSLYNKLHLVSK